jgi:hypothetical protein
MADGDEAAIVAVVSVRAIPRVAGVESVKRRPYVAGIGLLSGRFGGQLVADRIA